MENLTFKLKVYFCKKKKIEFKFERMKNVIKKGGERKNEYKYV